MVTLRYRNVLKHLDVNIGQGPMLTLLVNIVKELRKINVSKQCQNKEQLQQYQDVDIRQQLETRECELRKKLEARERELCQQLELIRNNVIGIETTKMKPKFFQPFIVETQTISIPRHLMEPIMDSYYGMRDLHSHVLALKTQVTNYLLNYKNFAGTLKDVAHKWIAELFPCSIVNYDDKASMCMTQFSIIVRSLSWWLIFRCLIQNH